MRPQKYENNLKIFAYATIGIILILLLTKYL